MSDNVPGEKSPLTENEMDIDKVAPTYMGNLEDLYNNLRTSSGPLEYRLPQKTDALRGGLTVDGNEVAEKLYKGIRGDMTSWNHTVHLLIGNEMALHVVTAVTSKPEDVLGVIRPQNDKSLETAVRKELTKEFDLFARPDGSRPYGGERVSNMLDFFAATRLALEENQIISPKDKILQATVLDRIAARTIVETFLPPIYRCGLKDFPKTRVPPIIAEQIANLPINDGERAVVVRRAVTAVSNAIRGVYDTPDTTESIDEKSGAALRKLLLEK
jgi:hypothetical protein